MCPVRGHILLMETLASWCSQEELISILVLQLVSERIEVHAACNSHCDNQIWGGDERVGSWVGIVTSSEVSVVG